MGVTFWGNFISGTLFSSISLAWHVLCHQFSREGSLCVREAAETAREFSTWPTPRVTPALARFQQPEFVACGGIDRWPFARHSLHSTKGIGHSTKGIGHSTKGIGHSTKGIGDVSV
jgi:hypothetical protein